MLHCVSPTLTDTFVNATAEMQTRYWPGVGLDWTGSDWTGHDTAWTCRLGTRNCRTEPNRRIAASPGHDQALAVGLADSCVVVHAFGCSSANRKPACLQSWTPGSEPSSMENKSTLAMTCPLQTPFIKPFATCTRERRGLVLSVAPGPFVSFAIEIAPSRANKRSPS